MSPPTVTDMQISLEDARFFHDKLDPIIRGPEEGQDLEIIRRYFRAYLHCWKSISYFVREIKGLKEKDKWIAWCEKWQRTLDPGDAEIFDCLRKTRDHDTHVGMIQLKGEIAAGLFPIVMFVPGKDSGPRRELISCCSRGLIIADQLIRYYAKP